MLTVGINQFLKNIRRNLITILQLILVYVIAIFTVSTFVEQFTLYRGVSDYIDETGVILWRNKVGDVNNLKDELVNVKYIETKIVLEEMVEERKDGDFNCTYYDLVALSDDVHHYKTPILKGSSCNSGTSEDGIIRVVVSEDFKPTCDVGDVVNIGKYTVKIMGIYGRNEIIYKEVGHSGKPNYLEWYNIENPYEKGIAQYYLIASYEDLQREGMPYSMGAIVIDYEDDITQEEMEYNQSLLQKKYKYIIPADMTDAKGVYETSIQLLEIKLVPMLVVFLLALIFAVASIMVSGSITVYAEQRTYGIYFLYGNSWKRTILLSVIHWALASAVALIISVCACVIVKSVGIAEDYALFFSQYHVCVLLLITVLLMLMAIILPYGILKKMQPINIIRNNL